MAQRKNLVRTGRALQELIEAKLADRRIEVPTPRTQETAELEEALRASLAQAIQRDR